MNSLNLSRINNDNHDICPCRKKLAFILSLNYDLILLQDTRVSDKLSQLESMLQLSILGSYKLINNSSMNSRGVSFIYKYNLDISISNIEKDIDENAMFIDLHYNKMSFSIGIIYAPNRHQNDFFEFLDRTINIRSDKPLFLIGDFNMVMDTNPNLFSNLDLYGAITYPNKMNRDLLEELIHDYSLIDVFRNKYPKTIAYSYVPFSDRMYGSRIDFVLCNDKSSHLVSEIEYLPKLANCFDHRPIHCKIIFSNKMRLKTNHGILPPVVDKNNLNHPPIEQIIRFETLFTLNQYSRQMIDSHIFQEAIQNISTHLNSIKDSYIFYLKYRPFDRLIPEYINYQLFLLDLAMDTCNVDLNVPENLNLSIDYDLFLNTLVNNIIIRVSDYQREINRSMKAQLNFFHSEFIRLSNSNNFFEARKVEDEILRLKEKKIKNILSNSKFWLLTENERASKAFCKLGKPLKKTSSLNEIRNQNGDIFSTENERIDFITTFFRDIYSKKNTLSNIEEFLGDILESNHIKKLSQVDVDHLEAPLTIEELEKSFCRSNKKGAGGTDGVSMPLLKLMFPYIKHFVLYAFNSMLIKGHLTYNFSNVGIRLIPKKDDTSKIGNWRPISLLSTTYKIVSGAITERLNSVIDSVLSVEQTGFSKNKRIGAGLVSILDSVNATNLSGLPAFMLSTDFHKAFDSISHNHILQSLRFFGFGRNFVNMISTLLKGKRAGILTDNGNVGPSFDVESGSGQGDPPSPPLFNIGLEILILKVKLTIALLPIVFVHNNTNVEISKVNAYADDKINLCLLNKENLNLIEKIYDNFALLSGLKLNKSKTQILLLNVRDNDEDKINMVRENCSFRLVDQIKTLGVTFNSKLDNLDVNFQNISCKIDNLITFWSKFSFTLYGRKIIANTFLLSQLSYISSIIRPNNLIIRDIENKIVKFIIGKEKLARERIFHQIGRGGLGFPKIEDFILSLRISFLKFCLKTEFKNSTSHFISSVTNENLYTLYTDPRVPLYPFAISFCKDKDLYFSKIASLGKNIFKIPFFNEYFPGECNISPHLVSNSRNIISRITNITIDKIYNQNGIFDKNHVEDILHIGIDWGTYFRLRTHVNRVVDRFKNFNIHYPTIDIRKLFNNKSTKSKMFRTHLSNLIETKNKWIEKKLRINNINQSFHSAEILKCNFIPNQMKLLFFKYINNTLLWGNQLSKFTAVENGLCNFCSKEPYIVPQLETSDHVLNGCPALITLKEYLSYLIFKFVDTDDENLINIDRLQLPNSFPTQIANLCLALYISFLRKFRKCRHNPGVEDLQMFLKNQLTLMNRRESKLQIVLDLL